MLGTRPSWAPVMALSSPRARALRHGMPSRGCQGGVDLRDGHPRSRPTLCHEGRQDRACLRQGAVGTLTVPVAWRVEGPRPVAVVCVAQIPPRAHREPEAPGHGMCGSGINQGVAADQPPSDPPTGGHRFQAWITLFERHGRLNVHRFAHACPQGCQGCPRGLTIEYQYLKRKLVSDSFHLWYSQ